SVGRDDVAGIAKQEEVTRIGGRNQIRIDARVRAGDEQGQRGLLFPSQLLEVFPLVGEMGGLEPADASNDFVHDLATPVRSARRGHTRWSETTSTNRLAGCCRPNERARGRSGRNRDPRLIGSCLRKDTGRRNEIGLTAKGQTSALLE